MSATVLTYQPAGRVDTSITDNPPPDSHLSISYVSDRTYLIAFSIPSIFLSFCSLFLLFPLSLSIYIFIYPIFLNFVLIPVFTFLFFISLVFYFFIFYRLFSLFFNSICLKIVDFVQSDREKHVTIPMFSRSEKEGDNASQKSNASRDKRDDEADWDRELRPMPSVDKMVDDKKVTDNN